jgi:hypothetical protein
VAGGHRRQHVCRGMADAIDLAGRPGAAMAEARRAVGELSDAELAKDAEAWLARTRELLETVRHPIVHGLAHYDEEHRWQTAHPRTGNLHPLDIEVLHAHRQELIRHAGDGWRIAHRTWT